MNEGWEEPTSKGDTLRVLTERGAPCPGLRTLWRSLKRCKESDYREKVAKACTAFSSAAGGMNALIMYDVTTLHFEVGDEDAGTEGLRKVGMSNEHRVDPQVHVGLLVDPSGFPLEVHLFEGNTAETTTILPVLRRFQERHGIHRDGRCRRRRNALGGQPERDRGRGGQLHRRLADHQGSLRPGRPLHSARDYFTDGQILESSRAMGTGKQEQARRIVYQWSFKRSKRDSKTINAQIAKAEKVAADNAPLARTRFLKVTDATKELDQVTIDRARQLAGLKGYVTNLARTRWTARPSSPLTTSSGTSRPATAPAGAERANLLVAWPESLVPDSHSRSSPATGSRPGPAPGCHGSRRSRRAPHREAEERAG